MAGGRSGAAWCAKGKRAVRALVAVAGALALVLLWAPHAHADTPGGGNANGGGGGGDQGDQGGGGDNGDGGGHVAAVLQCVTTNVGADGAPSSYTVVWGFTGLPNGTWRVPPGWTNTLTGGSGQPPEQVTGNGSSDVGGTWTSSFSSGSSTWDFHKQAITASPSSAPCSPAPQVPELPITALAPLLSGGGLAGGALLLRRRARRRPSA